MSHRLRGWHYLFVGASFIGLSLGTAPGLAADPPAASGDKRLEDSLDSDLFDDLKPAVKPAPPPTAKPAPSPAKEPSPEKPVLPPGDEELDRKLRDDLGGEDLGEGPEKDPLLVIGERMKAVQRQLARKDASEATVARQQQIVQELDKLIEEMAKKQCKPSPNSKPSSAPSKPKEGKPNGNKPAGDPMGQPRGDKPATDARDDVQKGQTEQADVLAAQRARLIKAWGHLPPKLREQLVNASLDEFLPAYERLIEDYYKRLAEDGAERP